MGSVITLKSDSNGNYLHASITFDDEKRCTIVEYHFNGELFRSKEYPHSELLIEIIGDITNEIDKML